jgi:hypothetical protein
MGIVGVSHKLEVGGLIDVIKGISLDLRMEGQTHI